MASAARNVNQPVLPVGASPSNPLELEIERLRAENAKLAANQRKAPPFTLKVGDKGGVSAYGLGRFPVTLYREQWEKLLGKADEIRAFIAENASKLKVKE